MPELKKRAPLRSRTETVINLRAERATATAAAPSHSAADSASMTNIFIVQYSGQQAAVQTTLL